MPEILTGEGHMPPEEILELLEAETETADAEMPICAITAKGLTVHAETLIIEKPIRQSEIPALWFISAIGSQTACKGVAANILKANQSITSIQPNDAARDQGLRNYHHACRTAKTGEKWSYKVAKLPRTGAWHLLLYNLAAVYDNEALPFMLLEQHPGQHDHAGLARLHRQYLSRRLSIPLHRDWAGWLWERGLENREIQPLEGIGRRAFLCTPDENKIAWDISRLLMNKELHVPEPV